METGTSYVKRSQRDYSLSFKLQVVQSIERGEVSVKSAQRQYGIQGNVTVINWLRKYGTFDGAAQAGKTKHPLICPRPPNKKSWSWKQKSFLEHQAQVSDKKVVIFDMMIDLAEKEYQIDIRKNPYENAVAERINGILKQEFSIDKYEQSLENMKIIVQEAIEIYNEKRPHFSNYLLTPNQMHKQNTIKMKTYKTKNSSNKNATTA